MFSLGKPSNFKSRKYGPVRQVILFCNARDEKHLREWVAHHLLLGFDKIIICPQIISDLEWVKSSYDSVRGKITSNWFKKEGSLFFEIHIPVNTEATVYLPSKKDSRIFESGKLTEKVTGIKLLQKNETEVIYRIGSGRYVFEVLPYRN